MKIARRFNVGIGLAIPQVPKGRLIRGMSCVRIDSAVPSGLAPPCLRPGVETPGYYRTSLRDNAFATAPFYRSSTVSKYRNSASTSSGLETVLATSSRRISP